MVHFNHRALAHAQHAGTLQVCMHAASRSIMIFDKSRKTSLSMLCTLYIAGQRNDLPEVSYTVSNKYYAFYIALPSLIVNNMNSILYLFSINFPKIYM